MNEDRVGSTTDKAGHLPVQPSLMTDSYSTSPQGVYTSHNFLTKTHDGSSRVRGRDSFFSSPHLFFKKKNGSKIAGLTHVGPKWAQFGLDFIALIRLVLIKRMEDPISMI